MNFSFFFLSKLFITKFKLFNVIGQTSGQLVNPKKIAVKGPSNDFSVTILLLTSLSENDEPLRRMKNSQTRNSNESVRNKFGERRNLSRNEVKTGTRPRMNQTVSRQSNISSPDDSSLRKKSTRSPIRQQTSKDQIEDASFKDAEAVKKPRQARRVGSAGRSTSKNQSGRYTVGLNKKKPRDNSSRFDD